MHERHAKLGRFGVAILAFLAVAVGLSVQAASQLRSSMKSEWVNRHALAVARAALERAATGAPEDWSHRHLIFSNPGSEDDAIQNRRYDAWLHITNDPRFIIQQKKRRAGSKLLTDQDTVVFGGGRNPWRPTRHTTRKSSRIHRDWGIGLGTGSPSPVSYPAKWSFDTSTASCSNDFVVYPTGAAGSSTQASIIAYFNLYSGCGGTVPSVDWAYDTGGTITGAPSFSDDGSQLAFIQTAAGVASLVLLRIPLTPPGDGSLNLPTTLTPISASSYPTCTAPCMTTFALNGSPTDSFSNPWVDYTSDSLFVGDDSGKLHKFAPVFDGTAGTPPAEILASWPVTLTSSLGSPVLDPGTGKVFVGTSGGIFYAVGGGLAGYPVVSGEIYGTSSSLGASTEEIVDAPIVDSAAGMAYVFVQEDLAGHNAVFQFPTSFTSGSGTEVAVGTFGRNTEFFLSGAFDNLYFNSDGSCSSSCTPSGNLFVAGNTGAPATLYQIPINANVMDAANTGPVIGGVFFGRSSPVTEFFNANGVAATGSVAIASDPTEWSAGGTRRVTVGSVTYSFVAGSLAASTATAVEVSLVNSGTSLNNQRETAQNLAAAIDANPANCASPPPCFGTGTLANASATATISVPSTVFSLTSTSGGAAGNFALSELGSGINVSGGDNGGSVDFIFLSTYVASGVVCPSGCVLSFDVTSGATLTAGTAPSARLAVTASNADSADGFVTGGIIVDNDQMSSGLVGTSQIYFLTLDNASGVTCSTFGSRICATQASQPGLN